MVKKVNEKRYDLTFDDIEDYQLNDIAFQIDGDPDFELTERDMYDFTDGELDKLERKYKKAYDDVELSNLKPSIKEKYLNKIRNQLNELDGARFWIEDTEYNRNAQRELDDFYNRNLKGHTREELEIGYEISMLVKSWVNIDEIDKNVSDAVNRYIASHSEYTEEDFDFLYQCVALAENYATYSDWYKDVNGIRPRWLF